MKKNYYYILFESYTQVLELNRDLRSAGIKAVISPAPRAASICCGTSLRVEESEITKVRTFLEENQSAYQSIYRFEQDFDNKRDIYC